MKVHTPLEPGLGNWIDGAQETSLEEADIVLIPGGSDVNPALYGHTKLPTTHISTAADDKEMLLITQARQANKFIIGICKGSQMLTVVAGGWLIQDVQGHNELHVMETRDGDTKVVNSSHHQMSYPYDLPEDEYELIGWSGESHYYTMQGNEDIVEHPGAFNHCNEMGRFKEPEVIWYPKIRGLAVQFHPEWPDNPAFTNIWLNELILQLL